MNNITLEILRQLLQNCGKSLRASDFKALLDWLEGMGEDIKPSEPDNGGNDELPTDADYAWWFFVTYPKEYFYIDEFDVKVDMTVIEDELFYKGNITYLEFSPKDKSWSKHTIPASNFNQENIVNSFDDPDYSMDGRENVFSKAFASREFLRRDGSIKINPDIINEVYQTQEMYWDGNYGNVTDDSLITKKMLKGFFQYTGGKVINVNEGLTVEEDDDLITLGLALGRSVATPVISSSMEVYDELHSTPPLEIVTMNGRTYAVDKGCMINYNGTYSYNPLNREMPISSSGNWFNEGHGIPPSNTSSSPIFIFSNGGSDNMLEISVTLTSDEIEKLKVNEFNDVYVSKGTSSATARDIISFQDRVYWGLVDEHTLNATQISGLSTDLSTIRTRQFSNIQTNSSNRYFVYAYPASLGTLSTIQFDADSASILSVCDLYQVTVPNKSGRLVLLNVYVNKNAGAFNAGFSTLRFS